VEEEMNADSENRRFQFQIIDLFALLSVVSVLAAAIKLSVRYLPPISEMPTSLGDTREGQNWVGQGGWAFLGYVVSLLVVAYCVKRIILVYCARRLAAIEIFALLIASTLPYLWFLCEPDWFNPFIYRVSCWVGGPIALWLVPTVSFLVDLDSCGKPKPLKRYLVRAGIEIGAVFPLWAIFWAFFSFFILGWGWL
jgi:hypothetical protein